MNTMSKPTTHKGNEMSAHTLASINATREEWDAVHVVNGMAYQPKEGVLSDEYYEAQAQYQQASKAQIDWKVKHYGKLTTELKQRDIINAILRNREEPKS